MVRPRSFRSLDLNGELTFNDGSFVATFNTNRNCMVVNGPNTSGSGYSIDFRGLHMSPDRVYLYEDFRKAPKINADVNSATEATREIANDNFEILGTNGVSAGSIGGVEGGVVQSTAGADDDQQIILPHLDTNQSAWTKTTWGTDQQTRWDCVLEFGATITSYHVWAGLKLTNTSVVATDDDQAYFYWNTEASASATYWHAVTSRAGVDTDTALTLGPTGAASTRYHLVIDIDSALIPRFYINGLLCATGAALVTAKDFIPYVGVQALTAAVRTLTVYKEAISRKAGA